LKNQLFQATPYQRLKIIKECSEEFEGVGFLRQNFFSAGSQHD
jgi:hypothetical protein